LFIDLVDVCELYEIPRSILEITITYNPECKELIEKTINRYGLNIGLDMHQKIYIVDDNYVLKSVKKLITIPGEIGLT
jgi:hypothetical protein